MTILERFNRIHVNFMIMIKKNEEEEDIDDFDVGDCRAKLIII